MGQLATTGRSQGFPPFALLEAALPRLTRCELETVICSLIDLLDRLDSDADLEDGDQDFAVDDYGCDEVDQGDREDDRALEMPAPVYATDQRAVLGNSLIGPVEIYRHD